LNPYRMMTCPLAWILTRQSPKTQDTIVIHTSRPDADKHKIKAWMEHYNLPFHEISCGKRLFKVYYDDKAVRYEGNWDAIINSL